jgi:hypothetical protein
MRFKAESQMASLRLSLALHPSRPARIDAPHLTSQLWKGGRAIGGTLDRSLRGKPDGSPEWCVLVDYRGDGPPVPAAGWDLEQINPGDRLSPEHASALFVVAMNVAPAAEEEFNDWYNTEHIPLLSRVPGVACARRFRAASGSPRYVAIYHLSDPEAYASAQWCEADQTPWIGRMRRFQSDRAYYVFHPAPNAAA